MADRAVAERIRFLRALWISARALYENDVAAERAYSPRAHQIKAALRAVLLALDGRNAGVELPTGTGKTLVACMAAMLWYRLRPASRVLLLVPSRTLVVQHFDVARWIAREMKVDRITDTLSGDPGNLRRTLLCADLLVSTPGILASTLSRGIVDDDVIASYELVIADEFDQFIVLDEGDGETFARYAEHWLHLLKQLPTSTRFLVKSATLGLNPNDDDRLELRRARRRSAHLAAKLDPVPIIVPAASYAAVVPYKPLRAVAVPDGRISRLLEATYVAKGRAHLALAESLGELDYKDVERRAPRICAQAPGGWARIRLAGGGWANLTIKRPVRDLFCRVTHYLMMRQHILEDLTLGLDVELGDCAIRTSRNEFAMLEDAPILLDGRGDEHFHFLVGGKTLAMANLIQERFALGQRGVLFVRTVTLLKALKPIVRSIGAAVFQLTGEMRDAERQRDIAGFRDSTGGVLVMTRTTGGRGLDLPFADYAVFYSPKNDPVAMWQEMSRIRSTVSTPKEISVLCYDDEGTRLKKIVEALSGEGRRVTLAG